MNTLQISENFDECPWVLGGGLGVTPREKPLIDTLRVLEFLCHFLGFIIATGLVAPRANHGNKPARSNSIFDALPHAHIRVVQLTSRLFSVSDYIFVALFFKTNKRKARSKFGSRSTLSSPAVLSWLNQLVVPWLATRGLKSLSQLAQTASFTKC